MLPDARCTHEHRGAHVLYVDILNHITFVVTFCLKPLKRLTLK